MKPQSSSYFHSLVVRRGACCLLCKSNIPVRCPNKDVRATNFRLFAGAPQRMLSPLELLQEPQIVAPEVANVVDAVFEHSNTFWPHAEGEAGVDGRVIAAVAQDIGMYHAAAEDFHPAGVFADVATVAIADDALHVHFGAGFGKGEVVGAEAHLPLDAKHAPGEVGEGAFEVGHGDVCADSKPFDLVELQFAAGGDLLVAVAHAGQNDADRFRIVFVHGVDLAGAGVGAQDDAGAGGVESVPHVAGGMVLRDVEQLEVVFVGLHVAAAIDLETHVGPDGVDFTQGLGGDVQPALPLFPAGQSNVNSGGGHLRLKFGRFENCQPVFVGGFQFFFDAVDALAE